MQYIVYWILTSDKDLFWGFLWISQQFHSISSECLPNVYDIGAKQSEILCWAESHLEREKLWAESISTPFIKTPSPLLWKMDQ